MLVRWTQPAADDLSRICDYSEERLGATQARSVAMAIYDAADSLKDMPRRGRAGRKLRREFNRNGHWHSLLGIPIALLVRVKQIALQNILGFGRPEQNRTVVDTILTGLINLKTAVGR